MWDIFGKKAKAKAAKLETRIQELIDKEKEREKVAAEEKRQINEALAEAQEADRLLEEERKRQEAAKTLATKNEEPYINIVSIDMDSATEATVGAIEMDWNEYFIKMLHKNGYNGVSDEDAVDQWFRDVCKHVVLETYEQAEEVQKIDKVDLGDGRTEYS